MKAVLSKESYALVEKLATAFAYSNKSLEYEQYLNAGLEGLVNAIEKYSDDMGTKFSTFATTCIRNKMSTCQRVQKRFDLVHDDNVELDTIDSLLEETSDGNMERYVKDAVLRANKGNEKYAEMFMLHIGLNGNVPLEYKEIGAIFNVTSERVRQVCRDTKKKIKANKYDTEIIYSFVG